MLLEDVMLSEVSQAQRGKQQTLSLICGIKKVKFLAAENRMVVARG
jgi:hypothetical protein